MDEIAWAAHQRAVKKSEEIRDAIIEIYGEYTSKTVTRARFDKLITAEERMQLECNCPIHG